MIQGLAHPPHRLPQITFDDGHVSNHEHAASILRSSSLYATFFLTAGVIGNKPGFMGWPQVRELAACGHSFGTHGWSHCFLTQASDQQLRIEFHKSRVSIEDNLGSMVDSISLPGGRYDARVLHFAIEAGYRRVYTSQPWFYRRVEMSLEVFGRVMVRRDMSLAYVRSIANQTPYARTRMWLEKSMRTTVRSCLGDGVYHALWSHLSGRARQFGSLGRDRV